MPSETHVIVGASFAGAKAAETLREEGFDGRVVLIGDEADRPYERPPLSKDYLRGEAEPPFVHPESFYAEHDIDLRTGTLVTGLDPAAGEVTLDGGERLAFDRALLATGAAPRRLPIPGAELDGVLYLRERGDSDAIRARAQAGGPAVIIGAGWIGAEVAASLRQMGLEVTIAAPEEVPLERVLGPEMGAFYRDVHADHGVDLALGTQVEAFEGDGRVERVALAGGRRIDCAFVVVGIGVSPRTQLATAAGLDVGDGILVDEHLRTSAPNVFAAGDVAGAQHPFYGRRLRVEHWANALNQGPVAARAMLGGDAVYDRIPYFFSDQYEVGMEYTGFAERWDEVLIRGDLAGREFIAFWLDGGRVVAGMNVNVWDVADDIERLVRSRATVDRDALGNPDTALAGLAS